MTSWLDGRRQPGGALAQALITACVTGIVTSVTMVGPLLLDISRDLGISVAQAGLLAAAAAVPQALGSPFSGLLSDRLGRRPMIVFSLGSVGVLGFAAALAPSFAALCAIRFAAGLLGSLAPTSLMAAVGDLFPAGRRARAMGWFNMGFSFAAIGGVPIVAAIGGTLGWRWAFSIIGLVLLALAACMQLWFPRIPPMVVGTSVLATYQAVWGVRGLLALLGANLMERSLFTMVTIYLPAFLMLSYHMTAFGVAPVLAVVAVGTIAGNVLGGWLGDRFLKPAIFVVAQLVAGTLGLLLFGAALRPARGGRAGGAPGARQCREPSGLSRVRLGPGAGPARRPLRAHRPQQPERAGHRLRRGGRRARQRRLSGVRDRRALPGAARRGPGDAALASLARVKPSV